MKIFYFTTLLFLSISSFAQKRILVYHETNAFRHTDAINQGITMFEDLGAENNDWITDVSQSSTVFTPSNLEQYDAVVFLNTSGNNILSDDQQDAFEDFIASGKGFVGTHAATDTYRDRSWDFYNQLVGAIIQANPNHTPNNTNADMQVINTNTIIDFLGPTGTIWNKDEEYYYWDINGGQISNDNTVLLEVERTGNNGFDRARPITWFKESITYDDDNNNNTPRVTLSGIKSFYTALGHNGRDYSGDANFRTMLRNATLWATDINSTLSLEENSISSFKIVPNPVASVVNIDLGAVINEPIEFMLYDLLGKEIMRTDVTQMNSDNRSFSLDLSNIKSGLYIAQINTATSSKSLKLIKN